MKLKRQAFSYPYIVWMLIFILAPMVLIVYFAFSSEHGGLTLDNLVTALTNEIYMQVLARSSCCCRRRASCVPSLPQGH